MRTRFRKFIPLFIGIAGALFLFAIYFGIVSWAESPRHALDFFWEDRWLVIPILLGFGVQVGLYSVLKLGLYLPASTGVHDQHPTGKASAATMGAGGSTSTVAMVACCAHHAADVLPILGLTAAATFLAEYRTAFMVVGLVSNLIGIAVILNTLRKARRHAQTMLVHNALTETI
ncbi:MAG TPA: hypothetical protein VN364_04560 [Bellilinea sp.]|nr:hypothetical protein [Bellilinea sp.]